MKHICISIILLLCVPTISSKSYSHETFSAPAGPYLGQKPPGITPEVFAPDIVRSEYVEGGKAFSFDLRKFYFNRRGGKYQNNTMFVIQYKDDQWVESVVFPGDPWIGSEGRVKGPPFISPDGKTMHFGERYRERTDDGWSEMKSLGAPYEDIRIMHLTASSKGTYVFDEAGSRHGDGVIRYSRLIDGKREKPRPFGKEINSGKWNAHPFIAPDESYIIWDGERDSGYGDSDIYISFRQRDGSWGAAINLGDKINTGGADTGGVVTPDGKYLFFNRQISPRDFDIYWVDAQIIETLRPQ